MQTIEYVVELPIVGDILNIDIIPDKFSVYEIEQKDSVIIRNQRTGELTRIIICRGKWQVEHFIYKHVITFEKEKIPQIGTRGKYDRNGFIQYFTVVNINNPKDLDIEFDKIDLFGPNKSIVPFNVTNILSGIYRITLRKSGNWVFRSKTEDSMNGKITFE